MSSDLLEATHCLPTGVQMQRLHCSRVTKISGISIFDPFLDIPVSDCLSNKKLFTLGSIEDPPGSDIGGLLTEFAIAIFMLRRAPPWLPFLSHLLAKGGTGGNAGRWPAGNLIIHGSETRTGLSQTRICSDFPAGIGADNCSRTICRSVSRAVSRERR
jgi:hypothetical protein